MAEEQLEGAGHEGGVVGHDEVEQHAEEGATPLTVQVQLRGLRTTDRTRSEGTWVTCVTLDTICHNDKWDTGYSDMFDTEYNDT